MFIIFTALLIAADQLTKWWASTTFDLNSQGQYVALGFYFTYVQNTGAAFGILQNGTLILGILSAIVSTVIFIFLLTAGRRIDALQRTALTLILAGALGNMIDRFRLGYVIDFIHFNIPSFSFPVFNVADSCVVVGAGLLLLASFLTTENAGSPVPEAREMSEAEFFDEGEFERHVEFERSGELERQAEPVAESAEPKIRIEN